MSLLHSVASVGRGRVTPAQGSCNGVLTGSDEGGALRCPSAAGLCARVCYWVAIPLGTSPFSICRRRTQPHYAAVRSPCGWKERRQPCHAQDVAFLDKSPGIFTCCTTCYCLLLPHTLSVLLTSSQEPLFPVSPRCYLDRRHSSDRSISF